MGRAGVVACGVLMGCTISPPALANAEPPPPCAYTLTPPERTPSAAGEMVTATVTPSDCQFPGRPTYGVACVQRQEVNAVTQCAQGRGEDVARVEAPYQPGATYVSTGRGCGAWAGIADVAPLCQLLGPLTATP